jgi:hypothetical protein
MAPVNSIPARVPNVSTEPAGKHKLEGDRPANVGRQRASPDLANGRTSSSEGTLARRSSASDLERLAGAQSRSPIAQGPTMQAARPVFQSPLHDFAGSLAKAAGLPQPQRCDQYKQLAEALEFAHASLSAPRGRAVRRALIDAMNKLPADETSASNLAAPLLATLKAWSSMSIAHNDSYLALDLNSLPAEEAAAHADHTLSYEQRQDDMHLLCKLVTKHGLNADMDAMTTLMQHCFDPKCSEFAIPLGALGISSMISKADQGKIQKEPLSRLLNQLADHLVGEGGFKAFVSQDRRIYGHLYGVAQQHLQLAIDQHGIELAGEPDLEKALATLGRLEAGD